MPTREWARGQRFNATTGAFGYCTTMGPTGANHHPDRCVCQGGDPTPHKHYEADYSRGLCARCSECMGYVPAVPLDLSELNGLNILGG